MRSGAPQSAANAVKSAQALVPFVDRKAKDVPTWVAFSARDTEDKCALGLGRVPVLVMSVFPETVLWHDGVLTWIW